jgi:hypothetical protein
VTEPAPVWRQDTEVWPGQPDPAAPTTRHQVEPTPLVAGMLFILIAVVLMTGMDLPIGWFHHSLAWIALIGAGIALLVNELVRARRRR